MNLQPTIFLSSIISEFYDLRGALKYFLGKSGFRVLMSEEPDFGADCDKNSLENCKSRIETSDYYFLLIGVNTGYKFQLEDGTETTVTFEEFRHFRSLKKKGEKINLIAFVRKQAWDYFEKKDYESMEIVQHQFIEELLELDPEENQLGRWRYTFDKFSDIISVLETNQNGLFTEATRKIGIYRTYLKSELTEILKVLLIKDKNNGNKIKSIKEFLNIPELKFDDYFEEKLISREIAIRLQTFIQYYSYKEEMLLKINRVFNYISQGEFAKFDPEKERYELPEYIKMTIQVLEILERVFIKFQRGDIYKEIVQKDKDNFRISEFKYGIVKDQLSDLNLATLKLINLMRCLHNNWTDFEKMDDEHYNYRGGISSVTTSEVIDFSNHYFDK